MVEIHCEEQNLLLMVDRVTEVIEIQRIDGRWSIMRQKPTSCQSSERDEGERVTFDRERRGDQACGYVDWTREKGVNGGNFSPVKGF